MPTFEGVIDELRRNIKEIAKQVKTHFEDAKSSETNQTEDKGEVIANLMLSYRHLEDASMRLGKVLQARNGGVSSYDHNVVGDPTEENKKEDIAKDEEPAEKESEEVSEKDIEPGEDKKEESAE